MSLPPAFRRRPRPLCLKEHYARLWVQRIVFVIVSFLLLYPLALRQVPYPFRRLELEEVTSVCVVMLVPRGCCESTPPDQDPPPTYVKWELNDSQKRMAVAILNHMGKYYYPDESCGQDRRYDRHAPDYGMFRVKVRGKLPFAVSAYRDAGRMAVDGCYYRADDACLTALDQLCDEVWHELVKTDFQGMTPLS